MNGTDARKPKNHEVGPAGQHAGGPTGEGKEHLPGTTCGMDPGRILLYVVRELPPDEIGTVERHLSGCTACRTTLHALRLGADIVPDLPADEDGRP